MVEDGHFANILVVIGFFILLFGSISYGGQILGKLTGTQDSVFIGAAGCAGLTGATLAACQKAQPKPKPKPITPAAKPKPKGITAARPKGITAAKPKPTPAKRAATTGGGVGGPRTKAFECKQRGGTWKCYTTGCICRMPITAPSPIILALNACIKRVTQYTATQSKLARDKLAIQYGYTGLNPGDQLAKNNAQTPSAGYQERLLYEKYNNLKKDLIHQCNKKYLGLDIIADQNRGNVPRSAADPKAGGYVAPGLKAGEYRV